MLGVFSAGHGRHTSSETCCRDDDKNLHGGLSVYGRNAGSSNLGVTAGQRKNPDGEPRTGSPSPDRMVLYDVVDGFVSTIVGVEIGVGVVETTGTVGVVGDTGTACRE